jgi:hypothetical protein
MKSITAVASVAALFAQTALAQLDPIVVKGSKFFYGGNGTQFFIKGVAYQRMYRQLYRVETILRVAQRNIAPTAQHPPPRNTRILSPMPNDADKTSH